MVHRIQGIRPRPANLLQLLNINTFLSALHELTMDTMHRPIFLEPASIAQLKRVTLAQPLQPNAMAVIVLFGENMWKGYHTKFLGRLGNSAMAAGVLLGGLHSACETEWQGRPYYAYLIVHHGAAPQTLGVHLLNLLAAQPTLVEI